MPRASPVTDCRKWVLFPADCGECLPATHAGQHGELDVFFIIMIIVSSHELSIVQKSKTSMGAHGHKTWAHSTPQNRLSHTWYMQRV